MKFFGSNSLVLLGWLLLCCCPGASSFAALIHRVRTKRHVGWNYPSKERIAKSPAGKEGHRIFMRASPSLGVTPSISGGIQSLHSNPSYVLSAVLWLSTFGVSLERRTLIGKALSAPLTTMALALAAANIGMIPFQSPICKISMLGKGKLEDTVLSAFEFLSHQMAW